MYNYNDPLTDPEVPKGGASPFCIALHLNLPYVFSCTPFFVSLHPFFREPGSAPVIAFYQECMN